MEIIGKARLIAVTNMKMICIDYDYIVGDIVLIHKDGILRKAESIWKKEPDHNSSSYEWNYQDSIRNQIGKN